MNLSRETADYNASIRDRTISMGKLVSFQHGHWRITGAFSPLGLREPSTIFAFRNLHAENML
jgi:hypothetical protein